MNIFKLKNIKKKLRIDFLYHDEFEGEEKQRSILNKLGWKHFWGVKDWTGYYDVLENRVIIFKDFPIWGTLKENWIHTFIHEMGHYFITHFSDYRLREKRNSRFDHFWNKSYPHRRI